MSTLFDSYVRIQPIVNKYFLLVALMSFIIGFLVGYFFVVNTYTTNKYSSEKLFQLVQEWRKDNNLSEYVLNNQLCDIAALRAHEIQTEWSHDKFLRRFNGTYLGLTKYEISENLAKGGVDEKEIIMQWLQSPEHLDNLKKPYTYSCIAVEKDKAVQVFANF